MATPTDILTLSQWFSPAFPVGAFSYSHGLEHAIDVGDVQSLKDTLDWIEDVLRYGAGWNDCLVLGAAYRAEDAHTLADIDAQSRALAASRERLQETDLQGAAFCRAISALAQIDLHGLTYPVAAGRAARLENIPLGLTTQMFLQSLLINFASVAMRLVPLGQSDGQLVIQTLTPICISIADAALETDLDSLGSTAFLSDIAAMRHETQYSRIFRT
ncbi:urease accessory UreF family protein [uncultured Shimia sp.]|uniref:urease accessory protein UreF n=1 Tax=uncultured Shimia sp. TaxID=573152 RepID=UPI00262F66F5|nr:urease accessory UreF family protein [uncultured Shimia sp.]